MSARGRPVSGGAASLLLLRGMTWSVPIWSGRGRAGGGGGSRRPPAAVAVDPCAWLLHDLLRFALRSSSLGSEWHGAIQKNSGAGQGRVWATPGNASFGVQRAVEGRAGAGGLGEPQSSPCRLQREIGKGSAGDGLPEGGERLSHCLQSSSRAPRVVWVWLTGDREGCLVMTAPAFGFL